MEHVLTSRTETSQGYISVTDGCSIYYELHRLHEEPLIHEDRASPKYV